MAETPVADPYAHRFVYRLKWSPAQSHRKAPVSGRMKRHRLQGLLRYIAGKLQEKYGQLIGDKSQQFEGVARQVEGKLQSRGLPRRTPAKRRIKMS
jgi:uncharacterized protein YjbJ (UPF0337 family)